MTFQVNDLIKDIDNVTNKSSNVYHCQSVIYDLGPDTNVHQSKSRDDMELARIAKM